VSENVSKIGTDQIIAEWDWNSRKGITPQSVLALAQSIRDNGLEQPVVVRPLADGYGLVSGFRRFLAVSQVLGLEEIDCFVREMTDYEARLANFRENGEREQLSFWEECLFIRETFPDECLMKQIQEDLNKNYDWVRPRRQIWTLPQTLIDLAEQGTYSARNIAELLKRDPAQQQAAAKSAEAAVNRGEEGKDVRKNSMKRRRPKGRKNISRMMAIIEEQSLSSDPRVHQLMLWAMGDLTKDELAGRLNVEPEIFLAIEE